MDPTEALTRLLSASLVRRRDRYVEFVSRPKAHKKFLNEFYHQLADCFDPRHVVAELPANAWSMADRCSSRRMLPHTIVQIAAVVSQTTRTNRVST